MTKPNYNVLKNLSLNIRVSRDVVLLNEIGEEIHREKDIPYSQVLLTMSDIEDFLEETNSIADNVVLYHKKNSRTPDLTPEQLVATRSDIAKALNMLINHLDDPEFMSKHVDRVADKVNRFIGTTQTPTHETTVTIMFRPDVLSPTLVYPARPGAIVNNFTVRSV